MHKQSYAIIRDTVAVSELDASVITLTYNRPDALWRCLDSLARQEVAAYRFEMVLVDVSDKPVTDVVKEFAGRLRICHVRAENRGVAANRNVGAREATAPLLVFLDDDCCAKPDWLRKMVAAAADRPGALVGGGVRNVDSDNAVSVAGQVITEAVDDFFNSGDGGPTFFPGLNFAVPREDYLALGGCDESFGRLAAEDREFASRWVASGRKMVAEPTAIVVHDHRRDLPGYLRQYFNYGKGAWVYHCRTKTRDNGVMKSAVSTHFGLLRRLGGPLGRLTFGMRLKVLVLLAAWEVSNLAGFTWQGIRPSPGNGETE